MEPVRIIGFPTCVILGYININFLRYIFAFSIPGAWRSTVIAGLLAGCAVTNQETLGTAGTIALNEATEAVSISRDAAAELGQHTDADLEANPQHSIEAQEHAEQASRAALTPQDTQAEAIIEPDLWSAMRPRMVLDHRVDQRRVMQEIEWLKKHPAYWQRLAPRMQRYLPYIVSQVNDRGLPAELALLPIIESALDPYAFSPYGASGLWQFMRPTARQYGLVISNHYDSRRDVVASTEAALDFLQDLYRRFEDWPLALAAYNAGGGTVSKAIKRGQTKDFFALGLPRETQAYVPRLLAIAAIVSDPQAWGVTLPTLDVSNPLRFVELPSPFDVGVVAQVLQLEPSAIYEFNPGLRRSQWSVDGPMRLILPSSWEEPTTGASEAAAKLEAVPKDERVGWREVIVRSGDTISEIAAANDLKSQTLRLFNNLTSDRLQIGQTLRIPGPSALSQPKSEGTQLYTVRSGDSLWKIAKISGVSVATLVKMNKIGPREVLGVGQKIFVPTSGSMALSADAAPTKVRKIQYRVRRGDSLSGIAQRFRIRVGDIVSWNNIRPQRYLQPGQGLTLYIDVVGG